MILPLVLIQLELYVASHQGTLCMYVVLIFNVYKVSKKVNQITNEHASRAINIIQYDSK